MRPERRCVQRKRPVGICYFEFEAGSRGIVLDASEKGLGFQAAEAVHPSGPSRIWISPRLEERIELMGDVVWTDASRKTGGLRFIETGGDSSKKIRNWLGSQNESEASFLSQESPLPAWATQTLGDLRHESQQDANLPRPAARPGARTEIEERPLELHSVPGLPSLFTSSLPWQPQDSQVSGGRIAHRVATGFLILVLAVASVVLFDMFRAKVGESLIHLGENINGSTSLLRPNPSPPPNSAQALPQSAVANEVKPEAVQTEVKTDTVQKKDSGDSEKRLDSSGQADTQAASSAIPRTTATPKEVPNLSASRAANLRPDRSAEATRLWSAVALGDSSAEVELARLYLRGEGVPRNCEQAKVLLRAAAKGGSGQARQQLRKLRSRSCR